MTPDPAILRRVIAVLASTFAVSEADFSADSTSADVDGWDSVSHTFAILALEDEFHVRLTYEETVVLKDVGALASLIATKAAA